MDFGRVPQRYIARNFCCHCCKIFLPLYRQATDFALTDILKVFSLLSSLENVEDLVLQFINICISTFYRTTNRKS